MSICDPIEYDYARALEEHQAKQVPIDPDECPDCGAQIGGHGMCVTCCEGWDEYRLPVDDDIPEGEDDIDWEQRGLPEAEGDESDA